MLGGIFRDVLLVGAIVVLTYSYVEDKSVRVMVTEASPNVASAVDKTVEVAAEVPDVVNDAVTSTKETIHEVTE